MEENNVKDHKKDPLENFKPKGAMLFFVGLILLFIFLWFFVYFTTLSRI